MTQLESQLSYALRHLMQTTAKARKYIDISSDEGYADYNATGQACVHASEILSLCECVNAPDAA